MSDNIISVIKSKLYQKAIACIESVRLSELAQLFEADPKPRVEKDHLGKPVVPNRQQFLMYFQDMQADHIKDALENAHERWGSAKNAAEREAIETELAIGKTVLQMKESADSKTKHHYMWMIHPKTNKLMIKKRTPKVGTHVDWMEREGVIKPHQKEELLDVEKSKKYDNITRGAIDVDHEKHSITHEQHSNYREPAQRSVKTEFYKQKPELKKYSWQHLGA